MSNAIARALMGMTAAALLAISGCATSGGVPDCEDGADNDGDGLIDMDDPGCQVNGQEALDPDFAACGDGADNDGDGLIDDDDPGCDDPEDDDEYNQPIPQCRNGIDDDGDGLVDYPNDPGCFLGLENSEDDDCPDGPQCPACSNGVDDDDDGLTDYPDDPGCDQAGDDDEYNPVPGECGGSVTLLPLPSSGDGMGQAEAGATNELISDGCGGSGQETVYTIMIDEPTALHITTDFPETTLDTVIYVRSECRGLDTELGCNDDAVGYASELLVAVGPGLYYIIVDAHNSGSAGDFRVQVTPYIPGGEVCDPAMPQCAPGLVCRLADETATEETCELPECSDGTDNDADGLLDFPDDPGCTEAVDNDEGDDCPAGASCPQCGNEVDDDGDALIDFPNDPGCTAASDDNEIDECIPGVEVNPLIATGVSGTTSGTSNFTGSCAFGSYPEDVYSYQLDRDLISLSFSTVGSTLDTVTHVRLDACDTSGAELACADPGSGGETVTLASPQQGTYFVFVDGAFGSGDYVLNASGIIAGGDACEPADTQFVCEAGYACDGGTMACEPADCNDGMDNDSDGLTDYPNDPGCSSISDATEGDDCPTGPNCPQCSNGTDDDTDGFIDWPDDIGCAAAGDDDETDCPGESDPVSDLTTATVTGTTVGLTHDFTPSCSSSASGPDKVYVLTVPGALDTLEVDTIGTTLDTVLYVKEQICTNPDIGCNDEGPGPFGSSTVSLTNLAAGSYMIIVDGWNGNSGDYTLNVQGTIKAGAACDADQVAAGMLECASGYTCVSDVCAPATCNDGMDNDSDGLTDYPEDPGCASTSDTAEADDCPSGPNCPACANQMDDDGDGLIDYGSDPGCVAAGDDKEIDECIPGIEVQVLTDAGATGTTPPSGSGSNFKGTCHSSTASTEDVYGYNLERDLETLIFSTIGSTGDTVTHVREGLCGDAMAEIGCEHAPAAGEAVTIAQPVQGWYYVFVDGDFTSGIDYVLSVAGTLPVGEECDPADTQFTCATGGVCDAGVTPAVCAPTECNNGIDDDTDGLIDAFDPGCFDSDDDSEAPDPTPLPQCADGLDNDSDTLVDYPDDTGCSGASDDLELNCDDSDPIETITGPVHTGSTTGLTDDFTPSCSSSSTAPETVWTLLVPGDLVSLDIDTGGSSLDTVVYIKAGLCTNPDLDCNDEWSQATVGPSEVSLTNVPAGYYFVVVDGWLSNSGAYTLNTTGVIASGEVCDPAQVASGLFSCETGSCIDMGSGFLCQ